MLNREKKYGWIFFLIANVGVMPNYKNKIWIFFIIVDVAHNFNKHMHTKLGSRDIMINKSVKVFGC